MNVSAFPKAGRPSPVVFQLRAAQSLAVLAIRQFCIEHGLPVAESSSLMAVSLAMRHATDAQKDFLDSSWWAVRDFDRAIALAEACA